MSMCWDLNPAQQIRLVYEACLHSVRSVCGSRAVQGVAGVRCRVSGFMLILLIVKTILYSIHSHPCIYHTIQLHVEYCQLATWGEDWVSGDWYHEIVPQVVK